MSKILRIPAIFLTMLLAGTIYSSQVWATTNVLFIIDVSARMAGKFPDQTKLNDPTKMQTATDSLELLLDDLPEDLNVGLEVYGHRGQKDCTAIDLLNPVSPLREAAIMDNVRKLNPERGATPLAKALEQAPEALKYLKGSKTIVLFADGADSCGGNPDEVAKTLEEQGIIINVLGIDVKDDESAQLSGIAETGHGLYFTINNAEDLKNSLAAIKERLIDRKLEKKIFFRDDFNGDALSDQWMILNPDDKRIRVENGAVVMTVSAASKPEKAANILRLGAPDPENDWVFTANFNVIPQLMAEVFELGVGNASQQISAQIHFNVSDNRSSAVFLKGRKDTPKSSSYFHKKLISYPSKSLQQHADFYKKHIKSITLKLQKFGNQYTVSGKLEAAKENDPTVPSDWITLQKFTSLPLSDDTFFIRTYLEDVKNQSSKHSAGKVYLNWVEVETMKHSENSPKK